MISLHDLLDNLKRQRVSMIDDMNRASLMLPSDAAGILEMAKNAVCFDAGETSGLGSVSMREELFKLPYPTIWIEGKLVSGVLGVLIVSDEQYAPQHTPLILVFNKMQGLVWASMGLAWLDLENYHDVRVFFETGFNIDSDTAKYIRDAANVCGRFLSALNCSNTEIVEHKPGRFLNKQRERKGKQPIFSYWTLHIKKETHERASKGGTHSGPRLHLRRGHVREYAPGKFCWVQACMVGDAEKGVVVKDYALDAPKVF